jgi:simple sugar transport system permease protein
VFLGLSLAGLRVSGLGAGFVANEVITRLVRDGVMALALVVPVNAGLGLNFAVTVGALAAQAGVVVAVDRGLAGGAGLALIAGLGLPLAALLGWAMGLALNRIRGREMIATLVIGLLATGVYQLVFLLGYGTVIRPHNREMMLSNGVGIRNMVDLEPFRGLLGHLWEIRTGPLEVPGFMVLAVLAVAAALAWLQRSRLGMRLRAAGEDPHRAALAGIDVDRARVAAMVLSTVLACLGHLIFIQDIGMLNLYSAHHNTELFACAALLAGGASLRRASVVQALGGVLLFHTLFIVSPQAGQNLFANAALGEYFRTFVAYGTIACALLLAPERRPGPDHG